MANHPLFSIILATYNRSSFLQKAVQSVQLQTIVDWELIIINDGSQDDTLVRLEAYSDQRIIVCTHKVNKGRSASRNLGLQKAAGQYICFLDDDDYFSPQHLEGFTKCLSHHPDASFMVTNGHWLLSEQHAVEINYPQGADFIPYVWKQGIQLQALAVKADIAKTHAFDNSLFYAEDFKYILPILLRHPVAFTNKNTFVLVEHKERSSRNTSAERIRMAYHNKRQVLQHLEHHFAEELAASDVGRTHRVVTWRRTYKHFFKWALLNRHLKLSLFFARQFLRTLFFKIPLYMLCFLLLLIQFSCRSTAVQPDTFRLGNKVVLFANTEQAAESIIRDQATSFFEDITKADMALQMGVSVEDQISRDEMLEQFKASLQAEVSAFSDAEKKNLQSRLEQVWETDSLMHALFPDTLKLIKVSGKHYGSMVFYTREKCIVFPAFMLSSEFSAFITPILVHELSHIFTRYHAQAADELYGIFHFVKTPCVSLSDTDAKRRLLNPDGVSMEYGIPIRDSSLFIIPYDGIGEDSPKNTGFMQALSYELLLMNAKKGCLQEDAISEQFSQDQKLDVLYKHISQNTDYVNHPDEIVAENVRILYEQMAGSIRAGTKLDQQKLDQVEQIIRAYAGESF